MEMGYSRLINTYLERVLQIKFGLLERIHGTAGSVTDILGCLSGITT